jgi:hypothetical protein
MRRIIISMIIKETTMRKKSLSIITLLIVFLVFTVNIKAFMIANETNIAYSPPPPAPNGTSSIRSITLDQLIADGGSRFFKSAGHIDQFFSLVESSEVTGPDYRGLQKNLDAAIYYLEQARTAYLQLKNQAAVTPYNQEVISRLLNFDYDSFQKENGFFPVIFEKVKGYLAAGDVTGIYNELHSYTGYILDLLYVLKKDIDAGTFPDISTVWNVNQKYSVFRLFGQYVAQVFYRIK